ncbi:MULTISPECIES: ATP-grasp domain-containing protein [Campylobacter]|uniref:ATP-grasp domain-containing protein n=1 Tax=Campylobacter TaxID=194 RepID=UPI000A34EDA4|nr:MULTISPECIES: ATP-grasp domain-containing protein [Campylobacter]
MKKVLLLGGSHFQVPSVKCAKKLGYYTITCDYLPDNPGHKFADEYHNVSTTDKEAVLKLAQDLKIDGIVCYASDPSAPTAAYVAEKMGLPGQPYKSVEILSNKDLFRQFLTANGFNVPRARGFTKKEDAHADWDNFKKPVMVKPVDSSGSKGVSKIEKLEELDKAIDYALSFSRCKRFIIEEYIEKFGYQIAGDGFSVDGKLVFRCFANEHFNIHAGNPFVPIGESWPYNMPQRVHDKLHAEIQKVLDLLHMRSGAYNFDARIDENENVYLMEIGPRNGGNLIAQVTDYATGVDMVEYTIKAAMGENCSDLHMVAPKGFWSCFMIHSKKAGILKTVEFSDDFKNNNLVEFEMMYKPGEHVDAFNGSNGTLGTMILKFDSMEEMLHKMDNMDDYVKVIVE